MPQHSSVSPLVPGLSPLYPGNFDQHQQVCYSQLYYEPSFQTDHKYDSQTLTCVTCLLTPLLVISCIFTKFNSNSTTIRSISAPPTCSWLNSAQVSYMLLLSFKLCYSSIYFYCSPFFPITSVPFIISTIACFSFNHSCSCVPLHHSIFFACEYILHVIL